jgi:hypothetical protein
MKEVIVRGQEPDDGVPRHQLGRAIEKLQEVSNELRAVGYPAIEIETALEKLLAARLEDPAHPTKLDPIVLRFFLWCFWSLWLIGQVVHTKEYLGLLFLLWPIAVITLRASKRLHGLALWLDLGLSASALGWTFEFACVVIVGGHYEHLPFGGLVNLPSGDLLRWAFVLLGMLPTVGVGVFVAAKVLNAFCTAAVDREMM